MSKEETPQGVQAPGSGGWWPFGGQQPQKDDRATADPAPKSSSEEDELERKKYVIYRAREVFNALKSKYPKADFSRLGDIVDNPDQVRTETRLPKINESGSKARTIYVISVPGGGDIEFEYVDGTLRQTGGNAAEKIDAYAKDPPKDPTVPTGSVQKDSEGYLIQQNPVTKTWDRVLGSDGKPVKGQDSKSDRTPAQEEESRQAAALNKSKAAEIDANLTANLTSNQIEYYKLSGRLPDGSETLDAQKQRDAQSKQKWEENTKFPYEVLEARYKAERDLWTQKIAAGTASVAQAKEQLAAWKLQNFDIPHQQYQDQLTRAQEQRLRQSVEDERAKAEADIALRRATLQQSARQLASDNLRSLLPYSVGNSFSSEFAAGLGALGRSDPSGVNFSADAFTFKAPDFEGAQEQAAKNATKGVKGYKRTILDDTWTNALPAAPTYSSDGIPQIPNIDFTSMATGSQQSMDDFNKYVQTLPNVATILKMAEQPAATTPPA